jgi:hypothetical protein
MSGSSSAGAPASAPGGSTSSAASKPISASGPLSRSKEPGGIKLGEKELDLLRTLRNQGVMARSGRWDRVTSLTPALVATLRVALFPT